MACNSYKGKWEGFCCRCHSRTARLRPLFRRQHERSTSLSLALVFGPSRRNHTGKTAPLPRSSILVRPIDSRPVRNGERLRRRRVLPLGPTLMPRGVYRHSVGARHIQYRRSMRRFKLRSIFVILAGWVQTCIASCARGPWTSFHSPGTPEFGVPDGQGQRNRSPLIVTAARRAEAVVVPSLEEYRGMEENAI